jgi:amino-acid N-acetyltransferase
MTANRGDEGCSIVPRQAGTDDAAAIRALLTAANLPTADLDDARPKWFLLAESGGVLVGTIAVEPCGGFGLLRSLAVQAQMRGQGIGRGLVAAAEARAMQAKLRGLYLLTTTARGFFQALDYDELEQWELPESIRGTEEFRSLCPKSAVAMMKRLL